MSFSDIYANEVLESRRTRSDRARFWAKIVSFALMITVGVTLRSDPDLRGALIGAAMDGVGQVTGAKAPAPGGIQGFSPDLAGSLSRSLSEGAPTGVSGSNPQGFLNTSAPSNIQSTGAKFVKSTPTRTNNTVPVNRLGQNQPVGATSTNGTAPGNIDVQAIAQQINQMMQDPKLRP